MPIRGKDIAANGKAFGFDTDADFIPFEFSDEEEVDDTSRDARASLNTDSIKRSQPELPLLANGDTRKRKRRDYESSPEHGRPSQRQKLTQISLNPWQTDINDYASYKETARMYFTALAVLTS